MSGCVKSLIFRVCGDIITKQMKSERHLGTTTTITIVAMLVEVGIKEKRRRRVRINES